MKFKKIIIMCLTVMFCFLFSACNFTNTSKILSTNENIYNFYCDSLLKTQNSIETDINKFSLNTENKSKINATLDLTDVTLQEEIAIISGIECYNLVSSPKEVYLDIDNGVIFVKQQGRSYISTITIDEVSYEYEFSISKDSITNEYTVNYKKNINEENLLCSAKVVYDMSQSRLSIKIQSYSDKTGQKFESYKDCYSLVNNNKALRINILQGDTNNRSIYVIDTYKEIINFKTKVASCNALSGDLLVGEINENTFISSSSTDKCGFILEYDADTQNPAINTFGDLTKW